MRLPRLLARKRLSDVRERAREFTGRADAARDGGRFAEAGFLYGEAVRLRPERADLHVQAGHMFKELNDFAAAERHYRTAADAMPDDADLALQLGHFFRTAGRLAEAKASFGRALALKPGWGAPQEELARLEQAGWGAATTAILTNAEDDDDATPVVGGEPLARGVTHDLAARPLASLLHGHRQGIQYRRLGRTERTWWGKRPVLRGVEAIRGICISDAPVTVVELFLNGYLIHRGPPKGGYELPLEGENPARRKYVFNIWIDLSGFTPGQYRLEARALDLHGNRWTYRRRVVIAPEQPRSLLPDSDGRVPPPDPADARPLPEQINARPSVVRAAGRGLFDPPPRAILVQRADQLGDLVVSVPALRRLRALFPAARLVGLVSHANEELAATLGIFDELVAIDFPASEWERRRVIDEAAQAALAERLAPYRFDLAIDLSEAESSRMLLPLAGAASMIGFRTDWLPNLDVDMSANTYDRRNDHEIAPHARKAQMLAEWIGVLASNEPNLARRDDLDRGRLDAIGLPRHARFAVLHAGARSVFSRWPHYLELAALLKQRTDLHVVMLSNDPTHADRVPDSLRGSDRFRLIHQRLAFDDFDALASFCTVFVGDDSGPKHLASLRGATVVSVQTARNNWIEWGQDTSGSIVTRRVPCAGCLIQSDLEAQECGRDIVCLTAITAEEVFAAVIAAVDGAA